MAAEYALYIRNRDGELQAIVTGGGDGAEQENSGFRNLVYSNLVNGVGLGQFSINADHAIVGDIDLDWQIDVYRSDPDNGIEPYVDFRGLFRDEVRQADENGQSTFTAFMVADQDFLARDIVAYPAEKNNRSAFTNTAAETVAKNIVTYNLTSAGGTADGRHFAVEPWTSRVSVEADGGAGGSIDYRCANKNVLDALQDVARIGSGDFNLERTSGTAWQFRWYNGQLGTDRSGSVTFSLAHGNMRNPVLRRNRFSEKTVVIAGGQGEGEARLYVRRTGANYDGTVNARVAFLSDTRYSASDGLNSAADIRLDQEEARDDLTFDVLQTPATLYGKHYFLGDYVTGFYQGVTATKQITDVTVEYSPQTVNPETIRVITENA